MYLREAAEEVEQAIVHQAAVEVVLDLALLHCASTGDRVLLAEGTFQQLRSPDLVPNVVVQESVAALIVIAILREATGEQDAEVMNVTRLGLNQLAVEDLVVIR